MAKNLERETPSGKEELKKKDESSPPTLNELFRFDVPEAEEKEVVIYKDAKGILHARLAEELEKK